METMLQFIAYHRAATGIRVAPAQRKGEDMMYCYEVIRENIVNGSRADRSETYCSNRPLVVGSLYMHLRDMKGAYRVLNELEVDYDD